MRTTAAERTRCRLTMAAATVAAFSVCGGIAAAADYDTTTSTPLDSHRRGDHDPRGPHETDVDMN